MNEAPNKKYRVMMRSARGVERWGLVTELKSDRAVVRFDGQQKNEYVKLKFLYAAGEIAVSSEPNAERAMGVAVEEHTAGLFRVNFFDGRQRAGVPRTELIMPALRNTFIEVRELGRDYTLPKKERKRAQQLKLIP